MREYRMHATGEVVDLDNPKIYEHLPQNINELRNLFFQEKVYSEWYIEYKFKEISSVFDSQKQRIDKLIQNFTDNEPFNLTNLSWYLEQVFLFQDEIENLC